MTSHPEGTPRTHLAAAYRDGSPMVARSHRLHRPRGGFCARGYCEQCPVRTDDGVRLSCETPSLIAARVVSFDPLRVFGRVGEWAPPWFWERRFRRPRALRQTSLGMLRHLSAAFPLPPDPAAPGPLAPAIETDVLVVGGGPAGLAAAALAVSAGHRVTVLSRAGTPADALETVVATGLAADRRTVGSGGALLDGAFCLGIQGDAPTALYRRGPALGEVRFERLVVATGAYDRLPLIAGNDLPGVIGLRAFERLAADGAFEGISGVAIVASGSELDRARGVAERFGVAVAGAGPVDASEDPPARVLGRRRVRGVQLSSGRRVRASVVVVGGMQPTYELQVHAGLVPTSRGSPGVIAVGGRPRFPLLVVGEAAGPVEPRDSQVRASEATATWLADPDADPGDGAAGPLAPERSRPPDPRAYVCLCEDVRVADVARAIRDGYDRLEHLKRRTGATTGPCQGKLCLGALCDVVSSFGLTPAIPKVRPPIRPVEISTLGGSR